MATVDNLLTPFLSEEDAAFMLTNPKAAQSKAMAQVLRGQGNVDAAQRKIGGSGWGTALATALQGARGSWARGGLSKARDAQATADADVEKMALLRKSGEKLRQEALAKEALAAQYAREDSKLVEENALKAKLLEEKNIYDEGQANLDANRERSQAGAEAIRDIDMELLKQEGRMELQEAKPAAAKKPQAYTSSAIDEVRTTGNELTEFENTLTDFKDEYGVGSIPMTGNLQNMVANYGGPYVNDQSVLDQAAWWKQYKQAYELPARHKIFGGAFTTGEREEWNKANVSPEMTGEEIRKGLERMAKVKRDVAARMRKEKKALNWPDEMIDIYLPEQGVTGTGTAEDPIMLGD